MTPIFIAERPGRTEASSPAVTTSNPVETGGGGRKNKDGIIVTDPGYIFVVGNGYAEIVPLGFKRKECEEIQKPPENVAYSVGTYIEDKILVNSPTKITRMVLDWQLLTALRRISQRGLVLLVQFPLSCLDEGQQGNFIVLNKGFPL